jgi:ABC-type sugar transport system ATPase subunit
MAEVELRNIEKRYSEDAHAVKGVSFRALDGEFVVLVGPSGCGKSTTLRMVAGLETSTAGEILIGGRVVNDLEPKDRDVAMVFQNYALYPHMSVFENMAFPLKMRKVAKSEITKQVEEAAKLLSIEHLLKRKPKELSGGERQRVAVGRAIVRKPKVFLFDEPLSNLDAALRTQMRAELKRIQHRLGATMLYVTHDQVEAMTMGDKIAVMNKGKLEQFGTPAEIYERPASVFVARFLGAPPMNLIPGKVSVEAGVASFVGEGLKLLLASGNGTYRADVTDGTDMFLGVRPEKLRISVGSAAGVASISGKLVLVEPIGSVTHFYIDCPHATGGVLVASVHNRDDAFSSPGSLLDSATYTLGTIVTFLIPQTSLHFFEKESGSRI